MTRHLKACVFPAVLAVTMPMCAPPVKPTFPSPPAPAGSLWQDPVDLERRDAFNGPWGADNAPSATGVYSFRALKTTGTSPGLSVYDAQGREWHVKQAGLTSEGDEGPIEVVLSRILSAVGYHQPPVYYLPSFTLTEKSGTRCEAGGRFRLHNKDLKDNGSWTWEQNPFVNTKPYQGLLVILLMFNSTDLKNVNNSTYEVAKPGEGPTQWFVVRDLGSALGESGRLAPRRGNPDLFDREPFVTTVGEDGFVQFGYRGLHQNIIQGRIRADDVHWAADLLARLSDGQWSDAFRAGGYDAAVADRFIHRLHEKIVQGQRLKPRP